MTTTIADTSCKVHLQLMGTSPSISTAASANPLGAKFVGIEVPDTADDGDHVTIPLSKYGLKKFWGIWGFDHTTTDDIIVPINPTTVVTSGTLRITVGGAADNLKRFFLIWGE